MPSTPPLAPTIAARIEAGLASGLLAGLHAVLAVHRERSVAECYFRGEDEDWGRPLGPVAFGPAVLHDLRSVTKSVVGLLYGIALDRGLVPPPEAPLLAAFPDYPDLAADPARARLTLGHALTMTLGLEWDEERSYADPLNSEIAMENAADRYRFALDRPVVAEPGARWIYSGGAVALVGAVLERGTGLTLPDFAREALFEPLGIERFGWNAGRDGVASAASGLRLAPPDLLKIGRLILAEGLWEGRRLVSEAWLDAAFTPRADIGGGLGYGYLFYVGSARTAAAPGGEARFVAGFGNGGQRLLVMPKAGVAAAILCGRYNDPAAWVSPARIWNEILLPALQPAAVP